MAKTEAAAIKEAEAAKKRAEKAKLLEEEEASSSNIKVVKKAAPGTKKKAKNDLGLLDGFVTEAEKKAKAKGSDKDAAARIGKLIAERAIEKGVKDVVFDRGGYIYHGRVKALAEAAREAGLNF